MRRTLIVIFVLAGLAVFAAPAHAYEFTRTLGPGDEGPDVTALQVRVAGWFPQKNQAQMTIDGGFGPGTEAAVKAFQAFYGLEPDGIAGPSTFAVIDGLEDDDGSTVNFDWSEFWQNSSSSCSAKANAYAGTFGGGAVAPARVKKNVKRLMWRLEAVRAKAGNKAIGINSAFRSVAYNECIGGASASQHMYGTAVDNRVAEISNRRARDLARESQFHGIGCYSSLSHNHMDIRMENRKLPTSQFWWWPDQDREGRDLADDNKPCWGESVRAAAVGSDAGGRTTSAFLPSESLLSEFEAAGEPADLDGAD